MGNTYTIYKIEKRKWKVFIFFASNNLQSRKINILCKRETKMYVVDTNILLSCEKEYTVDVEYTKRIQLLLQHLYGSVVLCVWYKWTTHKNMLWMGDKMFFFIYFPFLSFLKGQWNVVYDEKMNEACIILIQNITSSCFLWYLYTSLIIFVLSISCLLL